MNNIRDHTKKSKNALKGRKSGIQPQPPQKQEQKKTEYTHQKRIHFSFVVRGKWEKKYQIGGRKKLDIGGERKYGALFFSHIYM